jgi:site-specific DNA-cytosine methylase
MGRPSIHGNDAAKQKAYRERQKRNAIFNPESLRNISQSQVVLSLFPGADLWGRAFEELGFCVVRAPDTLWGGDIREFRPAKGRFDGIIGGAPSQVFSRAAINGSKALNLIPEFLRVVSAANPRWAILENVREAKPFAPSWDYVFLRDWDCGGLTHRTRGFWFYGFPPPAKPAPRPGTPEYSVLASNWNKRGGNKISGHLYVSPHEAGRLQGFPDLPDKIMSAQPGWIGKQGKVHGVSKTSREILATHMIGNGVTHAVGLYIAQHILQCLALSLSQSTKQVR